MSGPYAEQVFGDVAWTFTSHCVICGSVTHIKDGEELPHRCRIDLDAQREAWRG